MFITGSILSMMKFLVSIVLISLLSFIACLYLPWWSIAIVSLLVAIIFHQKPLWSFLAGFCALFLLWTILAFIISSSNNHILAHRMSLVILKSDSPFMLTLITGLIGAMVAGFAALAGSFVRISNKASDG